MFQRFMMAVRSFFGLFVRGLENPELMLQQYMEDLRSQVPRLNNTVAEVMKMEVLQRDRVGKLEKAIAQLDHDVIAAVKLGPQYENEAKMLIAQKQSKDAELVQARLALQTATTASQQAKSAREDYLREMDTKIQTAKAGIGKAKQAQMQEQLANLMMTFKVGDQSDVLDRMTEKIDERSAKAQAKVELATTGVDHKMAEIRRASTNAEVDTTLLEYKRQLGLAPAEEEAETSRTLGPVSEPPQTTQGGTGG